MANIKITFNNGEVKEFKHEGRGGGSYTKRLKLEGNWAIITDEWDRRTVFPLETIKCIEETPERW